MNKLILCIFCAGTVLLGQDAAPITISTDRTMVGPGGTVTLTAKDSSGKLADMVWTLGASDPGTIVPSGSANSTATYTAPTAGTTSVIGTITVCAQIGSGTPVCVKIDLIPVQKWESRSVVGFQQAAASSSDSKQSFFLDFFIERGLDKVSAADAKFLLWGNVRLASVAQQINGPVSSLSKDLTNAAKALPVNQLVQSAEFVTGFEFRPQRFIHIDPLSGTERTLGFIAEYGETGPLTPRDSTQIFNLPPTGTPQYTQFQKEFGTPPDKAQYVGFTTPDRSSFFKQYGFGFRVTTFDLTDSTNPPGTYTFTVGQDQAITGGRYHGVVGRFDVFYPVKIPNIDFKFVYLFGTVNTRLSPKSTQSDPIILSTPTTAVDPSDSSIMLVPTASTRDTYRIGIGLDVLSILQKIKVTTK